jgi:hypothetical protein
MKTIDLDHLSDVSGGARYHPDYPAGSDGAAWVDFGRRWAGNMGATAAGVAYWRWNARSLSKTVGR